MASLLRVGESGRRIKTAHLRNDRWNAFNYQWLDVLTLNFMETWEDVKGIRQDFAQESEVTLFKDCCYNIQNAVALLRDTSGYAVRLQLI